MSASGLLEGASRGPGVVLLLAVLLLPALCAGPREGRTALPSDVAALVAPDERQEPPSEREAQGPLLLVLLPAEGDDVPALPEPSDARAALRAADRLRGAAVAPFPPPPPRRA